MECRISNANPLRVTYEWNLSKINGGSPNTNDNIPHSIPSLNIDEDDTNIENENKIDHDIPIAEALISGKAYKNDAIYQPASANPKMSSFINDGLTSKFKWRPTSISDFGEIKCKATNEIGSTECSYEIKLGGVPNPPTECNHILKNTSAIISCQVGFHQVIYFWLRFNRYS